MPKQPDDRPPTLTIGQLADYVGVTIRAIRHYHQRGLPAEPPRDEEATSQAERRLDECAKLGIEIVVAPAGSSPDREHPRLASAETLRAAIAAGLEAGRAGELAA